MPKNFTFKKIIGGFFGRRMRMSGAKEINSQRDWNIILISLAFIVLAVIVFNSYMYWRISSGSFIVIISGKELPIETIDRSEIKKIIDRYEAKSQLFQETKSKRPEVIDPSL
ncbi:MAG: hypothetical protein HW401_184 [Parcubacteria group bacterium]|nr:hypothetical protein [Parcubacteria group bacterium]